MKVKLELQDNELDENLLGCYFPGKDGFETDSKLNILLSSIHTVPNNKQINSHYHATLNTLFDPRNLTEVANCME